MNTVNELSQGAGYCPVPCLNCGGWIDRLKLAFINNLEEIEINSLEVERKKKCCH